MANYSIRRYNAGDYHAVRRLFGRGMLDYIPGITCYILKLPQVYGAILASSITLQLYYGSYVLSLLSAATFLAAILFLLTLAISTFIRKVHHGDLLNIEESYIRKANSCFWVAESGGRIVGMVGVQPSPNSNGDVILRRLSVSKEQQRRGIAKALCMTVIDFARLRGYQRVTLDTSTMQAAAHKLYQRMGFTTTKIIPSRSRLGRLVNMTVVYYSYDVSGR